MKTIIKHFWALAALLAFIGCEDESDFTFSEAAPYFSITAPLQGSELVLDRTYPDNIGLSLLWTDNITQDPNYTIEFALSGSDFAEPHLAGSTTATNYQWAIGELNDLLTETMGLEVSLSHNIDIRVKSGEETTSSLALTITPYGLQPLPRLAVPGNHQGWNPSETEVDFVPYLATSLDEGATDYEGYIWLDGEFKFVGPNDSGEFIWGNTDWGDDGSFSGKLTESDEQNCNASTAGLYFVKADTGTLEYSLEPVNWGIIGEATPTGWDSDTDLTYNQNNHTLEVTLDLTPGKLKFRGNDEWGPFDLGTIDEDGFLQQGGDITFEGDAGSYLVVLNLSNPRRYTVSFTKQ